MQATPKPLKKDIRNLGGLWMGKCLAAAARLGGKGGTTLPGRAAAAVAPNLLPYLAGQTRRGTLVVTGTNGKTTSAGLLSGIFRQAGLSVVHNRTGSNLTWGVSAAYINTSSWKGRLCCDLGVMEADEAAFPEIAGALQPKSVVVTNIFRDQLDRYGEVDRTRTLIQQGLKLLRPGSMVVLNADDPSSAWLKLPEGLRPVYYGLALNLPPAGYENTGRDLKVCPFCGAALTYSVIYFAHLGRYRCPRCSFHRPEPAVKLIRRTAHSAGKTELVITLHGRKLQFLFSLPGLYNVYNALAAAAAANSCGAAEEAITAGLEGAAPLFGRMEQFNITGRNLLMGLVKNPAGANEVLRAFLEISGPVNLLIAINDRYADGTDISWLWDVDFEQLEAAADRLSPVTVSGTRAADMGVRLKYAGLDTAKIEVEPDLKRALGRCLERTAAGEMLYILPTYTAMLELRRMINRLGAARPYWKD